MTMEMTFRFHGQLPLADTITQRPVKIGVPHFKLFRGVRAGLPSGNRDAHCA